MRGILFSILTVTALPLFAGFAQEESETSAKLSIHWGSAGDDAFVWFYAGELPQEILLEALDAGLGCAEFQVSETGPGYLEGTCFGVLEHKSLSQSGVLDFKPIVEAVRRIDAEFVTVSLSHAGLPLVRLEGVDWTNGDDTWSGGDYVYFYVWLNEPVLELVIVEWGYDPRRVRLGVVVLGLVFFGPIVWTLIHRRRVLAQSDFDENAGWFAYWRHTHWLSITVVFAWVTCLAAFSLWGVVQLMLAEAPMWIQLGSSLAFVIVPPLVSSTISQLLSIPILDHLRSAKGTGRRLVRASLLGSGIVWLPILFVALGVLTLFDNLRLGLLCIFGAFLIRVGLMALLVRDEDFRPHAVTVGELRDRLFALAKKLGVQVKQLYVVPAVEARMANAFAVQGGNLILTDFLLRNLDKGEIEGIVAHELAHLRHRHGLWLTVSFLAPIGVVMIILYGGQVALGLPPLPLGFSILVGAIASVLFFFYVSRQFELVADADAVLLTGDPKAMIRGLSKLTKANLLPRKWDRVSGWLLTHPSLEQRVKAIAARTSLEDAEVQQLVATQASSGESYILPSSASSESVYSTSFKAKILTRISLGLVALMVLLPAAIASSIERFHIAGLAAWVVYGFGAVFAVAAVVVAADHWAVTGQAHLRRRMSAKLEQEGIDSSRGLFVGFAPHRFPRLYENFVVWDVGFLFVETGRLVYIGDHARFQIARESVGQLELQDGQPSWRPTKRVYLRCDVSGESPRHVVWNVPDVRSVSGSRAPTTELHEKLERWRVGDVDPCDETFSSDLGPPPRDGITSESLKSSIAGPKVFSTAMIVGFGALLVNALVGLSFLTGGWYVLLVSIVAALVQLIPLARYREPTAS